MLARRASAGGQSASDKVARSARVRSLVPDARASRRVGGAQRCSWGGEHHHSGPRLRGCAGDARCSRRATGSASSRALTLTMVAAGSDVLSIITTGVGRSAVSASSAASSTAAPAWARTARCCTLAAVRRGAAARAPVHAAQRAAPPAIATAAIAASLQPAQTESRMLSSLDRQSVLQIFRDRHHLVRFQAQRVRVFYSFLKIIDTVMSVVVG